MDPRWRCHPRLDLFGDKDGLGRGWVEIYVLDGVARFHVATRLYRFDSARGKFVEDKELLARLPELALAQRWAPGDGYSNGRLWFTAKGVTRR